MEDDRSYKFKSVAKKLAHCLLLSVLIEDEIIFCSEYNTLIIISIPITFCSIYCACCSSTLIVFSKTYLLLDYCNKHSKITYRGFFYLLYTLLENMIKTMIIHHKKLKGIMK